LNVRGRKQQQFAEKLQTDEPGDWHDQIEMWWTGTLVCVGERTNVKEKYSLEDLECGFV
jgi:hypothetical protein